MGIFSKKVPTETPESHYPGKLDIGSVFGSLVDRRHDALYDRVRLNAGMWMPSTITCFQVPVGCDDPFTSHVRTFVDTNMMHAGQLSPPHEFMVRRVLFLFQPSTSRRDCNRILEGYQWDFQIMEKVMIREPVLVSAAVGKPENLVQTFGKGSWLNDAGDRKNDSTSQVQELGEGICWDLGEGYEKYLPTLAPFAVVLEGTPFELWADLDFYVMLDGLRDWQAL